MPRNLIWKSLAGLSLACVLSLACGGDGDGDDGGGGPGGATGGGTGGGTGGTSGSTGGGTGGSAGGGTAGDAAAGMVAVGNRACGVCHTGSMGLFAGNAALTAPNLTPHATGLGGWSEAQVVTAILTGVDNEGKTLCTSMQRYGMAGMTQTEAKNIAAYLKSIPAIANATSDMCQ
jgi:hypothetical protein